MACLRGRWVRAKPITHPSFLFHGAPMVQRLLTRWFSSESRYSITADLTMIRGRREPVFTSLFVVLLPEEPSSGDWSQLVLVATAHFKTTARRMGPQWQAYIKQHPISPPYPHHCKLQRKLKTGTKSWFFQERQKHGGRWVWGLAMSFCYSHHLLIRLSIRPSKHHCEPVSLCRKKKKNPPVPNWILGLWSQYLHKKISNSLIFRVALPRWSKCPRVISL